MRLNPSPMKVGGLWNRNKHKANFQFNSAEDASPIKRLFRMLYFSVRNQQDQYAWDYFMLVCSERAGIDVNDMNHRYRPILSLCDNEINNILAKRKANLQIKIQEVWKVEMLLLQSMPNEILIAKLPSIQENYRNLVGDKHYDSAKQHFPSFDTRCYPELRAHAIDLMRGRYWYQLNAMLMERGLKSLKGILVRQVWLGFLIVSAISFYLLGGPYSQEAAPPINRVITISFICAYFGTIGACISIARRSKSIMDGVSSDLDPVTRLTEIENGKTGIVLSVLVGGVFALILYLVFVSGLAADLLGAKVSPMFSSDTVSPGTTELVNPDAIDRILIGMIPSDAHSFALLVIWSFFAGFAEKLVPDILDRLAPAPEKHKGNHLPS